MSEVRNKILRAFTISKISSPMTPFLESCWWIFSMNVKGEAALGSNTGGDRQNSRRTHEEMSQIRR